MADRRKTARIAICEYSLTGQSGASRTVIQHLRHFTALGWQARLFVSRFSAEHGDQIQCPIVSVPTLRLGGAAKRRSHAWFAGRLLKRWPPDIVWGHGNLLAQDVLSLHNLLHLTSERLAGHASRDHHARIHDAQLRDPASFRHLIANSNLMKRDLVNRYGIAPERISVVYPGYDPSVFACDGNWMSSMRERRATLGLDESDYVVLFATSGAFAKRGIDRFLDGFRRFLTLAGSGKRTRRRILGLMIGKADREAVTDKLAERQLGAHVRYVGTVSDLENYYKTADVLVHSAVIEEFGQVVQEAVVCGCPAITSRWVGASEMMGPEAASYVLDEPEPEAIAQRLLRDYEEDRNAVRQRWIEKVSARVKYNTWEYNSKASHEICMHVKQSKERPD